MKKGVILAVLLTIICVLLLISFPINIDMLTGNAADSSIKLKEVKKTSEDQIDIPKETRETKKTIDEDEQLEVSIDTKNKEETIEADKNEEVEDMVEKQRENDSTTIVEEQQESVSITNTEEEQPIIEEKKDTVVVFQAIQIWDKGEKVEEIQTLINKFGYNIPSDGNFGPQTQEVLMDFQQQVGLELTGIVDELTYNQLKDTPASNLAEDYLTALAEKARLEEQKRKEEEERRKKQAELEKANEVFIPVNVIMQNPELPNGCEITALTSVLNYHGYNVSKTTMSDQYLPKKPFSYEGEKRFGPNPYEYFVGDPRLHPGGWYSYAPPVVAAANTYLSEQGSSKQAVNISGSSKEDILHHIKNGTPVVIWITLDLSAPKLNSYWYLQDSGEYYGAITNLHVVVLNGTIGDKVHVMNPLVGQVTYHLEDFFNAYNQMGKHALIVS